MSLSNTEVFAFTQVPATITKRWQKTTISPDTMQQSSMASSHRNSMISSIELSLNFDNLDTWSQTTFSASDDKSEDAIEMWRENRQLWTALERTVEKAVDEYVKHVRDNAIKQRNKTCDLPANRGTIVVPRATTTKPPPIPAPDPNSRRPVVPESIVSVTTGLTPNDSASAVRFDMSEISSIIRREIRDREQKKSKHGKKQKGKSGTLLNYLADGR